MSEFKVGDRVRHSQLDMDRGYGVSTDEGILSEVDLDSAYPYKVLWDWDKDFGPYQYVAEELEVVR